MATGKSQDAFPITALIDRVGRGATGRNAGQLTTYFERPLSDIAAEFGADLAIDAQRAFDDAHDLLDLMVRETAATVRVERFAGHMGMFSLDHLVVHLRNARLRRDGGLRPEACHRVVQRARASGAATGRQEGQGPSRSS